ncbi:S-adenosyl-L-methionine-dependent methyltransferase [Mycena sp. CBHHK59/15]|nr:S-adenosyl-L-methionine-dependent methyltransferase [Mycena sp. CBHHK59/15]
MELSNIISKAVETLTGSNEYTIPCLDSTAPELGPFDRPDSIPPNVTIAIRTIEAACAQLSLAVHDPAQALLNFEESACMLWVMKARVADILLYEPDGLHVAELASQIAINPHWLGCVLHVLVSKHVFKEVHCDVFANNRLSLKLLCKDPVASLVGLIVDEGSSAATFLNATLRDPQVTSSNLPEHAPFQRAYGHTVFDLLQKRFVRAMVGWREVTGNGLLPQVYPWEILPPDTVICDVGSGNGHATLELLKKFPKLKVVLQDLPSIIDQGKEYLDKENLDSSLKKQIQLVPFDFFKDTPVEKCDFYYIRHVLHDWPDLECKQILNNIRKGVKSTSKLLIHEYVLQHIVRGIYTGEAPWPLLPNYGVGRVRPYYQDINMMNFHNSKERTLEEFVNLGTQAGFTFSKIWDCGETNLLEFSIASL